MPSAGKELLTVAEVCQRLKISRTTFYQWRRNGRGPLCVILPSGRLRIPRPALDRWLDGRLTP
ncbi:helix-turn-helix transcriptional regulator [Actinomadura rupiterrae]|uniref:helix-turn-helix transcriptional regulator n=1 Tax=Actinomadura rupiterrae TaxID=559627 RepID=UPI0020A5222A|nr:helix-turn-helix domain-containing protein [Actinomadura rupiterrae]MCP2337875.1 excisionase family DNA binding protein [Actinomadura rupiterrae]